MAYRQTNHNGRFSAKTGSVYNRNHNDRSFDISHADNVHADMVGQNIIIHYDAHNHPYMVDITDPNRKTINDHEHTIYEELFSDSLRKQHARNEAARHPERNKTVDDMLNNKNTCPEETIFQIGSKEDGYPPVETLIAIFEDYQKELIDRFGENLHFLDASLHMDEAVPHLHIRKVWTYMGKDGLDISQNKALEQMGFKCPHPEKPMNKWNNAKITYSEWERDMKLHICMEHGLDVMDIPKSPGKSSLEKEEAIAIRLQEKISALKNDLVSEEDKNKVITDTNIFGRPKTISVTPDMYRRWQASAETKESNERMIKYFKEQQDLLDKREKELNKMACKIEEKELTLNYTIRNRVEEEIVNRYPSALKQMQYDLQIQQKHLSRKETELSDKSQELHSFAEMLKGKEGRLLKKSAELDEREKSINTEVKKSVATIITNAFRDFFNDIKDIFMQHFKGKHQEDVLSVIREIPIDRDISERLFNYGFSNAYGLTVGVIMDQALDADIRDAIHETGISYRSIHPSDIEAVKKALNSGESIENMIENISKEVATRITPTRSR